MRASVATASVICACAAVLSLRAQDAQTPPQFRAGVDVVQLDVSVLDKNRRPIRGLLPQNFTVTEDGKPQRIVTVAEMDAADRDPALSAWMKHVPRDVSSNDLVDQAGDGRLFALVLDDQNTPYDDINAAMAVRSAARYVIDGLGPSDVAAVVYVIDAGKTQDFTDDREKLLSAIDRFEPHEPEWVGPTPLGPGPGGADMIQRFAPSMARTRCQRMQPAIPTLDTVVARLATVPQRRKTLIFLGPGVGLAFGSGSGCQNELSDLVKEMFWKAQRGNVNIYGVDPFGMRGYENSVSDRMVRTGRGAGLDTQRVANSAAQLRHDFLKLVAENTGARAVVDTDAVEESLDAIFDEDGSYYLVGYERTAGKPDGKFHKLQVRVTVPDATVRTRSGFWATHDGRVATAKDNEAPSSHDLGLTGMEESPALPLRIVATPIGLANPGTAGRDADIAVTLTVRVPAPKQPATETVTLVRNIYDADNHAGPPSQETVTLNLQPGGSDDRRYDVFQRLRLAPGRYQVRLNAHSRLIDRGGTAYADLEVPDFTQASLSVPPVVLGAAPDGGQSRTDPLADILPIVPTTARDFSPSEHITAFVRLMQGGTSPVVPVSMSSQVLDQHSAVVWEKTDVIPAAAFAAGRSAPYTFALPLEGRSHGPHLLSISAQGALGRVVRRDLVFRVR
jgi:VWFA-related protein